MRRLEKIKRFEITGHLLRIDANKKKKDDIRCDIIISQTPTVCLTPVVDMSNSGATDPIDHRRYV